MEPYEKYGKLVVWLSAGHYTKILKYRMPHSECHYYMLDYYEKILRTAYFLWNLNCFQPGVLHWLRLLQINVRPQGALFLTPVFSLTNATGCLNSQNANP